MSATNKLHTDKRRICAISVWLFKAARWREVNPSSFANSIRPGNLPEIFCTALKLKQIVKTTQVATSDSCSPISYIRNNLVPREKRPGDEVVSAKERPLDASCCLAIPMMKPAGYQGTAYSPD